MEEDDFYDGFEEDLDFEDESYLDDGDIDLDDDDF